MIPAPNTLRAKLRAPVLCAFVAVAGLMPGAHAQQSDAKPQIKSVSDEIRAFCTNIADAARDRRYILQKQELASLQAEVDKRIVVLDKRRAVYEDWLSRRNEFLEKAEAGLVEIYKNMRPDAAAAQLELIDVEVAAAIVMKLSPRLASQILNEMKASSAAQLATIIASAVDPTTSQEPS